MKNTVRYHRRKMVLTQGELADKVGVQAQTIGNIENGKTNPRPSVMRKLAEVLRVPVEQLFEMDTEQEEAPSFRGRLAS